MTAPDAKACCPKCGGTKGLEYPMTVRHLMAVTWGGPAEEADSTETTVGLATCYDCGAKFNVDSLEAKGLIR